MSKILITGSSNGIGRATAELFLGKGFEVVGLDMMSATIKHDNYKHCICDLSVKENLPDITDVDYLFINAGSQNTEDDIKNNLYSAIYTMEKYGFQRSIKAVLFNASVSAHTGFEFPYYVSSKAGMIGYMKHVASKLAPRGVIVNSISCGGVLTDLNKPVMEDKELWNKIMAVTPLRRWATAEEIAEWVYFLLIKNKFCAGQDIIIDGGEKDLNNTFIWPEQ